MNEKIINSSSSLFLYNTLTQKKELFSPIRSRKVCMYCCGVTPYGNTHIGHTRTFFSYDLLFRILKDLNYDVEWARNITDIDDKIIQKAQEEGVTCREIANRYVTEQDEVLKFFQLKKPDHEPKVTEHIPQIISLIQTLIEKEYAYPSLSGVYFRVRKFLEYGKLSKNNIEELSKGVRIEVEETKEDSLDFVLWKAAKPKEIFWESPWGNGRPGWHIECSAMIQSLFGNSIDIHMGGRDLIFPHHEAEIAQSESAHGKLLSNYWLHTGMVTLYGEKMSKSTNHFVGIKDFLNKYPPEVLRLFFLSVSYTQSLDFTFEIVLENLKKLSRLYRFVSLVESYLNFNPISNRNKKDYEKTIFSEIPKMKNEMREFLYDDLNSSAALSVFFEFVRKTNSSLSEMEKTNCQLSPMDRHNLENHWYDLKKWMKNTLGLFQMVSDEFFRNLLKYNLVNEISIDQIDCKIEARNKARELKNWSLSDKIRDDLFKQGIQIQDTPSGTKWTVVL